MSFVDDEFAMRFFSYQRNYKLVSRMPIKLNCSCPVCGDSAKDKFKARFWYYYYKNGAMVHCFNCDFSSGFSRFLEEQDESMYREYLMEKRKENTFGTPEKKDETPVFTKTLIKPIIPKLEFAQRIDLLDPTHPIINYVRGRCIPESKWNRLWFTARWQHLVNSVKPDTYPEPKNENRLVIPIFNTKGEIESFQGRALKQVPNKYITIKAHEEATKIYGLDTADESKPVLIVEGPIDSLFLDNAIAITGGQLSLDIVPFKENRIWVLDNEPRSIDGCKRIEKLINAGEKVALFDRLETNSKDINDMVKDENLDPREISEYLISNACKGLEAKLRFSKWKKI